MSHIKTYARIKPSVNIYEDVDVVDSDLLLRIPDAVQYYTSANRGQNKITHQFHFDHVFQQDASQEEVFHSVAVDIVDAFLSGYNGTLFAYGQTGTGKTYTVEGGARRYSERGLASRAVSHIYQALEQRCDEDLSVKVSFLEIYQEVGYDLLNPAAGGNWVVTPFPKVNVMEGPGGSCLIRNLSTHLAASEDVAQNLLLQGQMNRKVAETPVNQRSSRSHAVFTISLTTQKPDSDIVVRSKLHLVDLAGSERVAKTGVDGHQLSEAKSINLSLHHLESVIIALQASPGDKPQSRYRKRSCDWTNGDFISDRNPKHVPYRNSLLTMLLRDSLGGNCLTAMIATVSLDWENLGESISTCRFAQRVACISNSIRRNEEIDDKSLVKILRKKIAELETEISFLKIAQSSEGQCEKMNDKLSNEEKVRCAQIIQDYIVGRLRDPVTAGITNPFKFRECLKILKSVIKESATTANRNCEDVLKTIPHRTSLGSSQTLRHSQPSSHHGKSESQHLQNGMATEFTNLHNHLRTQMRTRSQSMNNLEKWAEPQQVKQKCLTRTHSEGPSGGSWLSGKPDTKIKRPRSAHAQGVVAYSHNMERVSKKLGSPEGKEKISSSSSGSDITEMDLSEAKAVELNKMMGLLKEKHAVVQSQLSDLRAHISYQRQTGAMKTDVMEAYRLEKHLRKRQTAICSKLEKVSLRLENLTDMKQSGDSQSPAMEARQQQFGQYRKKEGCLNTRQVYEQLQSELQQNRKVSFHEDAVSSPNSELDKRVEATRQKLSHFKKLLEDKNTEENKDVNNTSGRLFRSPPHTSTPNGSRRRALEMDSKNMKDKYTDSSAVTLKDLDSFYPNDVQTVITDGSSGQRERYGSVLSYTPGTTSLSGYPNKCDTTSSPLQHSKHSHVSSHRADISNSNVNNSQDTDFSAVKHQLYIPSEFVNKFDRQEVFDVHQMGLFSKTFESALQSMLERDNAKLFSHESYDDYARQRSPYEVNSQKHHKSTNSSKSEASHSRKQIGGVSRVLQPYCLPSVNSDSQHTDLTQTSPVSVAETCVDISQSPNRSLPRPESAYSYPQLQVKATPEEDRESSFMAKAKEQKNRIDKIRKAQHAASVIQKAWRHYCAK